MPDVSQRQFAAALMNLELPVPEGLTSWSGPRPARRFGVYRNNVSAGLIEALAVRYPVVSRLVGEEFFRAMTREYVRAELPRSRVLIDYGESYPSFLGAFPPVTSLKYLGDVARLESAYWRAYHAADERSLGPTSFATIKAAALPNIRFTLHHSAAIVPSRWPIVSIWESNTRDAEVQLIDLSMPENALVARPALEVEVSRLSKGAATFLTGLAGGHSLAEAAGLAAESEPSFDLTANLVMLIQARIVTHIIAA